jgi:hypothetical protein
MTETIAPRLLLGFAVVAQALCFAVVVVVLAVAVAADPGHIAGGLALGLGWLVGLTLAGTALCTAALPVLVRHAQETDALDERDRRRWLIRLALWGPATMPVYWRRYVRAA